MGERQAPRVVAGFESQQPDHWRQGHQFPDQGQRQPSRGRIAPGRANVPLRSDSAPGTFLRLKKAQMRAPKAVTATAHKLAKLVYSMLRYGQAYVDAGGEYYESQYHHRALRAAKRRVD